MKKVLVVGLIFGGLLFGNSCTKSEEQRAEEIFNRSLNQSSFKKKIGLIIEAKNICAIDLANVELKYMKLENDFARGNLVNMEERLQNLSSANDYLDNRHYIYKSRMRQKIDALFTKLGIDSKNKLVDNEVYKSLIKRKGTYQSHITFYYNSAKIKDIKEAKKIKDAIRYILKKNPNARFSITGHSSSEGNHKYNKRLSQRRADSLEKFIGKESYIKTFSKGETELICLDGLYPYRDSQGEYHCRGGENRSKSRRVVIKRID